MIAPAPARPFQCMTCGAWLTPSEVLGFGGPFGGHGKAIHMAAQVTPDGATIVITCGPVRRNVPGEQASSSAASPAAMRTADEDSRVSTSAPAEDGSRLATEPSYEYCRVDAHRRIRITAHRRLDATDLTGIVKRQLEEQAWAYGTLYDLRGVDGATSRLDTMAVADHVEALVAAHGRRGPVALVTRVISMLGVGHAYALDSTRAGRSVGVFWEIEDAEAWLSTRRS